MQVPSAPPAEPGSPVEVLPRSGDRGPWCKGTLGSSRGFVIEVEVEGSWPLNGGEDVILASGPTGSRVAALGRYWRRQGNTAFFKRQSPWRPVDTRAFTRFHVQLRAHVRDDSGANSWTGSTIDVSLGGLAVAVSGTIASEIVEVAVGDATSPAIPCRIVGTEETDEGTVLHLAFSNAGAIEHEFIQALVDELSAALELAAAS
jgi:hypothetical protein